MADAELRQIADNASHALLRLVDEAGTDQLSGEERDMIGLIRFACDEIAEGERD